MLTSLFESLSSLTPKSAASTSHVSTSRAQHEVPTPASLTTPPNDTNSALHTLSPEETERARSLFLTLHVLFPHELLPALDLLDRGLVTRLTVLPVGGGSTRRGDDDTEQSPGTSTAELTSNSTGWEVYYIQSSSSSSTSSHAHPSRPARSHARKHDAGTAFYEVRLDSWNCSCPAFGVSAFQGLDVYHEDSGIDPTHTPLSTAPLDLASRPRRKPDWQFGGTATWDPASSTFSSVPSCKHILAAVLAKAAPRLFAHGVTDREVTRAELAGWGGGWGEFGDG